MKDTAEYKITLNIELANNNTTDRIWTVTFKAGGVEIYSQEVIANKATFWEALTLQSHYTNHTISYDYSNTGTNAITVEVSHNEENETLVNKVTSASLYVYGYEDVVGQDTTLDFIVSKILWNGLGRQEFALDPTTEAKLSGIISRKWNLPIGDKWTQLNYIADQVKAYITTYYEENPIRNTRLMVVFNFFDDLDVEETPPDNDFHNKQASVDEYAKGLALDADNTVYTNGVQYEEGTLRTNSLEQLTTQNVGIFFK